MRSRLLTAALLLAGLACGGDSPTEPTNASIAGTWSLSTINGSPLPFTIFQDASEKDELMSDVITIASNGTFTQQSSVRTTAGGSVTTDTESDAGTYTLNGTTVTFKFQSDNSTGTAALSDNTMTVAEGGFSGVYKKQ